MNLNRIVTVSRDPEVQNLAHRCSHEVFAADDPADALEVIQTVNPNLILYDDRLNVDLVRELIDNTEKNPNDIPVVLIGTSDSGEERIPGDYSELGIYDYIKGMQDYEHLQAIIRKIKNEAVGNRKGAEGQENQFFANELAAAVSLAGKSRSVLNTLKMTRLVASSRCNPVLVLGETGTGKELIAKAIHVLRHPNEPFVAVNCAALTANLLESELFGHVKGSFTGADRDKTGLLELAADGTLLLDEISEMPMNLQAKLLRVLEEKKFRKVGGTKNIACNATIIAASNRNLKREVEDNRFRRDLYYRLNISPIITAPLRSPERRDDISLLADYFLKTSTICPDKKGKITSLTTLAVQSLERHDWPGNIRELRNVIDRAIMLETTDKIGLNGIIFDSAQICETTQSSKSDAVTDFSLEKAERELICRALQKTGWQKTRAAGLLGITRATLYAKVKQYNIEKESFAAAGDNQQTPEKLESFSYA
ncbi:MAG: sigma-54-dependent Fis family transcriptional regulator [Sedimentisphaerales bacterium]|nr:sigma-54-dependent Fis family transcriptional regulator [Sedimentisphaerales bacterium]